MNLKISKGLLNDVTLNIENKGIIVVVGRNASGKTTLLRCLAGVYMPSSGNIQYFDKYNYKFPLGWFDFFKWKKFIRENIFYIDTLNILFEELTIFENITYLSTVAKLDVNKVRYYLNKFEMNEPENKDVKNLSSGTKQKIILSCALASEKNVLLLDEPEKNLDSLSVEILYDEIKEKKNQYIIFTSHYETEALRNIADKIYLMKNGKEQTI